MDVATISASGVGGVVDVLSYTGVCSFKASAAFDGGTTPSAAYKLQDCATSNGTFADVTGAAFSTDGDLVFDTRDLKRYIKLYATLSGSPTSASIALAVAGVED